MTSLAQSFVLDLNRREQFGRNGFLVISQVFTPEQCDALAWELGEILDQQQSVSPRAMGGLRGVLRSSPLAAEVARDPGLISLLRALMGGEVRPVRGIFFDKNAAANWSVPWHQDLAIAVAEKIETPGFGPWSVKDEVVHVQPPTHILAEMITVRLHLDDCSADNGALRVIPGSHQHGELSTNEIAEWSSCKEVVVCEIPPGGALLMRPLLLHASSRAKSPSHRRVLHIEYAAAELPNGLRWFEQS